MKNFPATLQALDLVARGHSRADAANMAGISRSTLLRALAARNAPHARSIPGRVVQHAREIGLLPAAAPPAPAASHRSEAVAFAIDLVRGGETAAGAARRAQCSRSALCEALKAEGVAPGPRGRRPQLL